jgi:ketosteroid isomerase-like protein
LTSVLNPVITWLDSPVRRESLSSLAEVRGIMRIRRRSDTMQGAAFGILAALWLLGAAHPQATAQDPLPDVGLPAPLARVLSDYEGAWRSRDARALALLFAEDGFVLSSGRPPVRGRAGIERHYAGQGGPLSLRALAFATEGPLGYIVGGFARQQGDPDIGKFTLTLRQAADGRWLIFSDMDNGNSRP